MILEQLVGREEAFTRPDQLAEASLAAAILGAGQGVLVQALLRQGLVDPLRRRVTRREEGYATLLEPMVDQQTADLLRWFLVQEGDGAVLRSPPEGVQVMFHPINAGFGWVRLFRVDGEAYQTHVAAAFERLVEILSQDADPTIYGLMGLPIGITPTPEGIREWLLPTRWSTGHWMTAIYVPGRGGFAPMGLGSDFWSQETQGGPDLPEGSHLAARLAEEPLLDLLPGRAFPDGMGALWGGEAAVYGLRHGMRSSLRVDVQWAPVPFESLDVDGFAAAPNVFLGANLGDWAEVGLLGVLVPTPANRILVAFEPRVDPEQIGVGLLDAAGRSYLVEAFHAEEGPMGLSIPKAKLRPLLETGLPIWNRMLRLQP